MLNENGVRGVRAHENGIDVLFLSEWKERCKGIFSYVER